MYWNKPAADGCLDPQHKCIRVPCSALLWEAESASELIYQSVYIGSPMNVEVQNKTTTTIVDVHAQSSSKLDYEHLENATILFN